MAAVALVGLVVANGTALAWRATWWATAGRTSRAALTELDAQVARVPADAEVWVVGLPDHLRHAYIFRNAFPSVGAVRGYRQTVHAVLDDELPPGARAAQLAEFRARPRAVVLSYAGGRIVRGSDPAR